MKRILLGLLLIFVISCKSMPGMEPGVTPQETRQQNIAEALASAGKYIHLYDALDAADMLKTLQDQGPFTIFAPTDTAFANFIPGAEAYLLNPDNRYKLQGLLKYHIVRGKMTPEQLKDTKKIKSMLGMDLTVSQKSSALYIDKAPLPKQPIVCSNGLIYGIDSILIPKH